MRPFLHVAPILGIIGRHVDGSNGSGHRDMVDATSVSTTITPCGPTEHSTLFDNDNAFFNAVFSGDCRIATGKKASPKRRDRRARELGVGGELFGIGY